MCKTGFVLKKLGEEAHKTDDDDDETEAENEK